MIIFTNCSPSDQPEHWWPERACNNSCGFFASSLFFLIGEIHCDNTRTRLGVKRPAQFLQGKGGTLMSDHWRTSLSITWDDYNRENLDAEKLVLCELCRWKPCGMERRICRYLYAVMPCTPRNKSYYIKIAFTQKLGRRACCWRNGWNNGVPSSSDGWPEPSPACLSSTDNDIALRPATSGPLVVVTVANHATTACCFALISIRDLRSQWWAENRREKIPRYI